MDALFPALRRAPAKTALRFGDRALSYGELADVAGSLARELRALPTWSGGQPRVAVWASSTLETSVAVVAALLAGVPVVPVNPKAGERELAHILSDCTPSLVLCAQETTLPAAFDDLDRKDVRVEPRQPVEGVALDEPDAATAGMIIYTSGTTGPPKGVVLPRRAIAGTLDALAEAWAWTDADVVMHALPLFHVHGLVLGTLGPLRRGGGVYHLGRFAPSALGAALTETTAESPVMVFGVPTMYHRLAEHLDDDKDLAKAVSSARLLVSGSAALPLADHERITRATGQEVIERYGMTETLMNTSVRVDGPRRPGTVGVPLPGMDLRLVDDTGGVIDARDGETIGEIQVRGASVFTEYLNRPDATANAFADGWFRTGDMATMDAEGFVRIVGRKATDLIKSGGYKIGAGEIENALLEHPGVAEVAVTGENDPDLGERIVAWVVPTGARPTETELADHVARLLSPHKRPRIVRFVTSLPRNELGKVTKRALHA
ncbi:MAG: AMP-binding protein [Actinophytocola sp.]|nr:AMP-binding protein [Actinophytocola sp.]